MQKNSDPGKQPYSTDRIFELLQAQLAQLLEIPAAGITPESNLFELGLESISVMELMVWIERTLKVWLEPRDIFINPTLRELAGVLQRKMSVSHE